MSPTETATVKSRPWGQRQRVLKQLYRLAGITNSKPTYRYIPTVDLLQIIEALERVKKRKTD